MTTTRSIKNTSRVPSSARKQAGVVRKSKSGEILEQKARYYQRLSGIYLATLLFCLIVMFPGTVSRHPQASSRSYPLISVVSPEFNLAAETITAGKPVRIIIPSLELDIVVDDGIYNEQDGTWSLSGTRAQFALISTLANNKRGNTFIYGHNNKDVFGKLKALKTNDQVQVMTGNGHNFFYTYQGAEDVTPDNVTVLAYQGPPQLTVQTCSGSWNEWRRMYRFNLERVVASTKEAV